LYVIEVTKTVFYFFLNAYPENLLVIILIGLHFASVSLRIETRAMVHVFHSCDFLLLKSQEVVRMTTGRHHARQLGQIPTVPVPPTGFPFVLRRVLIVSILLSQ
jgi:hypothetical protein